MGPRLKTGQKKRGFTIMEMLLVVAVIVILSAILLPMGNKVLLKAKIATVKKSLKDFEKAVDNYRKEYGRLPIPGGMGTQDLYYNADTAGDVATVKDLMSALGGDDAIAAIPNPKGIIFFNSDLITDDGLFKDPWGYNIGMYFDANYDNVIDDSVTGLGDFQRTTVAYSPGPDGRRTSDEDKDDDITSLMRTTP